MSEEKPTSYLAGVKSELQGIFDEAFRFVWTEVEKALKESYRNGFKAGQKSNGDGETGRKRQWKRGGGREDPQ